MSTAGRLGVYGGILAAVFAASYELGGAVVPHSVVDRWTAAAAADAHAHGETATDGLALAANGYRMADVEHLDVTSANDSVLAFRIVGRDGQAVKRFDTVTDSELHLVIASADGAVFHHLHPQRDPAGRWWLPWRWERGGTYRVYADFRPTGGTATVLSTQLTIGGDTPAAKALKPTREATVDGYRVELRGDLGAGGTSTLTAHVTRDGRDVTGIEPYLGEAGHLVVLRDGDLAYGHAHAGGGAAGPDVAFDVTAPTPGRYRLHLELKLGGEVHTFPFLVETTGAATGADGDHEH